MSDEQSVSRREILRGSLATAFALGMPAAVSRAIHAADDPKGAARDAAKAAQDVEPVKVAWIGSGTQGYGQDMLALTRIPGVQIVAVCDIYEPNLKRGLERAGTGAEGYTDYRKMLERKDIQAVGIATPLYLHAPMAIAALDAGKHVYCEKMMAYTVEDAKKMVRTADRTGRILQVGHQRRYSVDYHHALAMVRKGYFGEITHVRAQWNRRNNWRRPIPDKTNKELDRLLNWRLYKDRSRGLMAELGSHQIDVANWYLGASGMAAKAAKNGKPSEGPAKDVHPIAVVGIGGIDYWKDGREVFDNVQVVFEYPDGQKLCYQSIEMNSFDGDSEQFMGRNGTLIMTESGKSMMFREPGVEEIGFEKSSENRTKVGNKNAIILDATATTKQDKRDKTAGQSLAPTSTAGKNNWHLALEDWVDCIRTGRKPFCDGRIGLADTACVIAANRAMETGTRIEMPEDMFKV